MSLNCFPRDSQADDHDGYASAPRRCADPNTSHAIREIVARAARRAGLPRLAFHRLRLTGEGIALVALPERQQDEAEHAGRGDEVGEDPKPTRPRRADSSGDRVAGTTPSGRGDRLLRTGRASTAISTNSPLRLLPASHHPPMMPAPAAVTASRAVQTQPAPRPPERARQPAIQDAAGRRYWKPFSALGGWGRASGSVGWRAAGGGGGVPTFR
jgi:hypothetical protein